MNLVLANLLSGFIFLPIFVLTDILEFQSMQGGMRMCSIMRGISTLISTASVLSQFLICADQYLAVLYPLNYHRHINELRCKLLCISVWIISTCLSIANACNVTGLDLFQSCNSQWVEIKIFCKKCHFIMETIASKAKMLMYICYGFFFLILGLCGMMMIVVKITIISKGVGLPTVGSSLWSSSVWPLSFP